MEKQSSFRFKILSPAKPLADIQACHKVILPSCLGELTILPAHTPLIGMLDVGKLSYQGAVGSEEKSFFVAGGFFKVSAEHEVTVLVDVIDNPSTIDLQRAEKAKNKALERLSQKSSEVDIDRALRALKRAEQRLKISKAQSHLH